MKLTEYKDIYDCAPYTLEEFAQGAAELEDNLSLQRAAQQLLSAISAFESALEDAEIELG